MVKTFKMYSSADRGWITIMNKPQWKVFYDFFAKIISTKFQLFNPQNRELSTIVCTFDQINFVNFLMIILFENRLFDTLECRDVLSYKYWGHENTARILIIFFRETCQIWSVICEPSPPSTKGCSLKYKLYILLGKKITYLDIEQQETVENLAIATCLSNTIWKMKNKNPYKRKNREIHQLPRGVTTCKLFFCIIANNFEK